jgi:hypothetical protein
MGRGQGGPGPSLFGTAISARDRDKKQSRLLGKDGRNVHPFTGSDFISL